MNWQEILTILVPILALMGWVYNRIEKKADERQHILREELREIRTDVKSIDQRLTRLEGRFDERGYWESRKRTGTESE